MQVFLSVQNTSCHAWRVRNFQEHGAGSTLYASSASGKGRGDDGSITMADEQYILLQYQYLQYSSNTPSHTTDPLIYTSPISILTIQVVSGI